jgi:hypothetical protein
MSHTAAVRVLTVDDQASFRRVGREVIVLPRRLWSEHGG